MSTTGKFLFGFVTGALAGATVGLLLAPDSGEETRKLIVDKFDEYTQKGKEFYETKRAKKEE